MLLKNLMEDKQLDFNQPLLSARRYTSPSPRPELESKKESYNAAPNIPRPPVYRSELKSGPVRNPGKVPFVWEKTPGRPKEERKLQTHAVKQPSITPKLPPGRVSDDIQHCSSSSQNVSSLIMNEAKCGSSNGEMEEIGSSGSVDSGEAYLDAVDTLSRTESFFLNCSISGVSGFDGSDIKPSGIFSTDSQTLDFMMGRFLPAAKAVASETPPYATRKQLVIREPQTKKLVIVNKQQPNHVSIQNYVPNHAQDGWWEGSEDENDDDDYSQSEHSSAKACGLLPQFLLKNSLCLLNPISGMKFQASKPLKPAYSVRSKQAKSSHIRSCNDTENEHAKATTEKELTGLSRIEEIAEDKNNLKSGSMPISYRSGVRKPDGESLFRYLQGNDISSHPNQISHLVHYKNEFAGIPGKDENNGIGSIDPHRNGGKNFRDLLAIESSDQELGSDSPAVEKTLYVDSVHKVISSNSPFSDISALAQLMEEDSSFLEKRGEVKETPSVDSSLQDIEHTNSAVDEKMAVVQHKSLELSDSYSPGKYTTDLQLYATRSRRDQDLIQDSGKLCLNMTSNRRDDDIDSQVRFKLSCHKSSHGIIQDSITVTQPNAADRRKIDSEGHQQKKSSSIQERSHGSFSTIPLALPLPKAPSESWLKRTLPAVSSRNSSRSGLGTPNFTGTQASPVQSGDPKWETIVRSSNVHHGHLRFSQEQLPPIPEA